jgi:outer membrane protein OmpA-like peptidoglycan-associated protein
MFQSYLKTCLACFIVLVSCGCTQKTTVVLLSDPDGHVGHLTIVNNGGAVDMSLPAEATVVTDRGSRPGKPEILQEKQIAEQFSVVLATVPKQPKHYLLYFQKGSTNLTADSEATLPQILHSIKEISSENISVIGHSDTDGDWDFNLRLSRERALTVSHILMREGIQQTHITSTSHGEENPLVKTGNNVPEPRNRRVEVVIK